MGRLTRLDGWARGIRSFVESPITDLVKGLSLMVIGVADLSRTFREDFAHGRLRVGHGLIIIGFFGVLSALPHLIEALQASTRYLDYREEKKEERALEES
ncbi:hypothetical protein [Singulisphaera sp. PoT]|uniref:hypothetical protein n=1 Tax=Singulisphaera sp. PoT TaxID=3411797 RepID=UPI003BF59CBC